MTHKVRESLLKLKACACHCGACKEEIRTIRSYMATLESEKAGEVVLGKGIFNEVGGYSVDTMVAAFDNGEVDFSKVNGKTGQLIFRPTEDK